MELWDFRWTFAFLLLLHTSKFCEQRQPLWPWGLGGGGGGWGGGVVDGEGGCCRLWVLCWQCALVFNGKLPYLKMMKEIRFGAIIHLAFPHVRTVGGVCRVMGSWHIWTMSTDNPLFIRDGFPYCMFDHLVPAIIHLCPMPCRGGWIYRRKKLEDRNNKIDITGASHQIIWKFQWKIEIFIKLI